MSSLQTKIGIWNAALDRIKEQPLSSPDDGTAVALWLSRNYEQQRDYLLQNTYLWKFAQTRAGLPADSTPPAWGWSSRFLLPTDCLRFVPPTLNGDWNAVPVPYEEEDGYLLCNISGPLKLRYVRRVTNEGLFSNGFCEVLSLRLAVSLAHWMTGKASLTQGLEARYRDTLLEVREVSAVQVAQDTYYDTDILGERVSY